MKLVDLNILLYAVNRDAAQHLRIRAWWENALKDEEPVGLAWIAVLGFLRLSTNRAVFADPLEPDQALDRVDAWLAHPNVRLVGEAEGQWPILRRLIQKSGTAGNLTTDAYLASLAITLNATLVTCDSDFARFVGLRWENPLAVK